MSTTTSRLTFGLLATIAFVVTGAVSGAAAYFIGSPAEFFATLIVGGGLLYGAIRASGYRRWPVITTAFALLIVTMWAQFSIKKALQIGLTDSAEAVSLQDDSPFKKTGFFRFTNARPDWDRSGYYLLNHYGEHHYYAVPLVSDNGTGGPVRFWTWCRTKKPQDAASLRRILPEGRPYGMRLADRTMAGHVRTAMESARGEYGLEIHQDPIIIDWGLDRDPGTQRPVLLKLLAACLAIVWGGLGLEALSGRRTVA